MECIPKTLALNCGVDVVRTITSLRAKHQSEAGKYFGIDGNSGKIVNMMEAKIWEPVAVKLQVMKTAIESACMLIRIDDVVSGMKKKTAKKSGKVETHSRPRCT